MTVLSERERSRAILLLSFAAFSSTAAFRVCDPQLPQLVREFSTTTSDAALSITAFSLAYGVMQLLYGPLGDRIGKFRVVAMATCGCVIGSVGCLLSTSLTMLVISRSLAGATAAAIVPMSMAWIGDAVPYADRQTSLARFLTGTILGMSFGQVIGGVAVDLVDWRAAYAVLAAIYLVVGTLLLRELRRTQPDRAALSDAGEAAPSGRWHRQRAVVSSPWSRVVIATVCVEGALVFGALAFLPTYIHMRFGLPLSLAGGIAAAYALGGLAYTMLARRLLARWGEPGLALAGGLTLCGAFALMALAPIWQATLLASIACGLGVYMLHGVLQTNATQMVPTARGTAVSLFAAALFIGQSAGVAAASTVVESAGPVAVFWVAATLLPLLAWAFSVRLARHRALDVR